MKNPRVGDRVRSYSCDPKIGYGQGTIVSIEGDYVGWKPDGPSLGLCKDHRSKLVRLKLRKAAITTPEHINEDLDSWKQYRGSPPHKTEGLSLVEALKTGKPLRRPIAKHAGSRGIAWLGADWVKHELLRPKWGFIGASGVCNLGEDDLMAEDWEVKGDV